MRRFNILLSSFFSVFLAACGGGNDGGGSSKNLSKEGAITKLYNSTTEELVKGDFEPTTEYENRINNYVGSLTGYTATDTVRAKYDADTQELVIRNPSNYISDGENKYKVAFYTGYSSLYLENLDQLYYGEIEKDDCIASDGLCDYKRYRILSVSPDEAERIIDGFRVDYTFSFSREQVERFRNNCISANFTQCINYLYADIETYRVYNIVDGEEY